MCASIRAIGGLVSLIETVPFVPGGEQYSIEEVLGHPIGGEEGIPEPQKYREYLLWWPDGRGFFGGAVLAAGLLLDNVEVLYGRTPLPPPIMEDRSFNVGLGGTGGRARDRGLSGHGAATTTSPRSTRTLRAIRTRRTVRRNRRSHRAQCWVHVGFPTR